MINYNLIKSFMIKHGPSILTGCACFGVVLTGYFTHKAAMDCLSDVTEAVLCTEETETPVKDIVHRTVKKRWKNYIPAIITGVVAIGCSIWANQWHMTKEGMLASAAIMYKTGSEELEKGFIKKFGSEKIQEVKKEIADKERLPKLDGIPDKMKIWEPYTQQWFYASQKDILWAELTINKMLAQQLTARLSDILTLFGCKNTKEAEKLGWTYNDECFVQIWAIGGGLYGNWIDFCPQTVENLDGSSYLQMEYGVHPVDLAGLDD